MGHTSYTVRAWVESILNHLISLNSRLNNRIAPNSYDIEDDKVAYYDPAYNFEFTNKDDSVYHMVIRPIQTIDWEYYSGHMFDLLKLKAEDGMFDRDEDWLHNVENLWRYDMEDLKEFLKTYLGARNELLWIHDISEVQFSKNKVAVQWNR